MLDRPFMMEERIKKMLDEELVKALKALAGYKVSIPSHPVI